MNEDVTAQSTALSPALRAQDECQNTDTHLWPIVSEDAYAPSIHATAQGSIGMNVGGYVIVMPIRDWHALAEAKYPRPTLKDLDEPRGRARRAEHALDRIRRIHPDMHKSAADAFFEAVTIADNALELSARSAGEPPSSGEAVTPNPPEVS